MRSNIIKIKMNNLTKEVHKSKITDLDTTFQIGAFKDEDDDDEDKKC